MAELIEAERVELEVSSPADTALGAAVLLFVVAAVLAGAGVLVLAGLGAALVTVSVFALAACAWCLRVVVSFRPAPVLVERER
jgi:uncharacterized membrane protein YjjP (DUF1212 family)